MRRISVILLLSLGLAGTVACNASNEDAGTAEQPVLAKASETALAFDPVSSSHYSGWRRSTEFVATTKAGWQHFWTGHDLDGKPAQEIDFDSRIVIGVMRRFTPYAGKTLVVEKVVENAAEIHVSALLTTAGLFCNELLDDVQLTEIVSIEKTEEKPVRITVESVEGRAPCVNQAGHDWKQRVPYDEYVIQPSAFLTDASKEPPARSMGEGTFR